MLVIFCFMATSLIPGTAALDGPQQGGTTVCAHPSDGHRYLVGNEHCYIVPPQVTLNISAPWGINAGMRGILHAGYRCQNLGSCVFIFPFWGNYIGFLTLDTSHSLCSS